MSVVESVARAEAVPPATVSGRINHAATLTKSTKTLILTSVMISLFLAAVDGTIISTALPSVVADLQGMDLLAWVTTAYLLASTTMVPIYGKLSDRYGRRAILLAGIVLFLCGSALCGLAPTMLVLVLCRALQGLGAAALTSTAYIIPADLYAPEERARYQGIFGAVFGLASVIGPYAGGLLTDNLGWRWVFYANVPVGVVALALILFRMPKLESGLDTRVEYSGALLLLAGVVPLLLALTIDKGDDGWGSPLILGLFAAAVVGLALFVVSQYRSANPILPPALFRNRSFTLISAVSVPVGAAFMAAVLFLSIFLVNALGISATSAGTAVVPLSLSFVVSSLVASAIVQRTGRYKVVLAVGMLIVAAAFWWLSTMTAATSLGSVRLRMVLMGLGLGPGLPLLTAALQNAVPREDVAAATSTRQFLQQLGQVLGAAVFGAVLSSTLTAELTTNMAPVLAKVPANMAAIIDLTSMRNGSGTGDSASQAVMGEQMLSSIQAGFREQRQLLTSALRDNDAAAVQALLDGADTPDQLKAVLQAGGIEAMVDAQVAAQRAAIDSALRSGDADQLRALVNDGTLPQALRDGLAQVPAQSLQDQASAEQVVAQVDAMIAAQKPAIVAAVTEQVLTQANAGLDMAEAQAVEQATTIALEAKGALEDSFVTAVTTIYRYGVPMSLLAFVLTLFIPEQEKRAAA